MNIGQQVALAALWVYKRAVSPLVHTLVGPFGGCRFHPTCSAYAAEAVRRHGVIAGSFLAAKRICRCQPWGGCGEDPVPHMIKIKKARLAIYTLGTPLRKDEAA